MTKCAIEPVLGNDDLETCYVYLNSWNSSAEKKKCNMREELVAVLYSATLLWGLNFTSMLSVLFQSSFYLVNSSGTLFVRATHTLVFELLLYNLYKYQNSPGATTHLMKLVFQAELEILSLQILEESSWYLYQTDANNPKKEPTSVCKWFKLLDH